jgi:putative transposase
VPATTQTTNMQERLIEVVCRRERVIRTFPNDASALRLIGALLAEKDEDWGARRHLEMDEFTEWTASKNGSSNNQNIVALTGIMQK